MNAKLVRESPPSTALGRKQTQIYNNLVELHDTPGEWGRIDEPSDEGRASRLVFDLRNRKRKVPDPEGAWDFVWATIPGSDPARYGIWARYNPEPDTDLEEEDDDE